MARTTGPDPTELLDRVAQHLQPLLAELVFVGGATVGLLITDPASERPRITRDVDAATRVPSRSAFGALEEAFRRLGFGPDTSENAPNCRWVKDELIVDLLTDNAEISGFTNPWYSSAIDTAQPILLPSGLAVRIVDAPHLIATKLVAWRDRGGSDWYSSDLEDIMLVFDGRPEVLEELAMTVPAVRRFIASELRALLADADFDDMLPGFLGGDSVSQKRATVLRVRIEEASLMGG